MKHNKRGKSNPWVVFLAIALVALLGVMVYAVGFREQQTAFGGSDGDDGDSGAPYISTGATTLNIISTDALQAGTSVPGTSYISKDGAAFSTGVTSASPNQVLDVLYVNDTTYHNAFVQDVEVPRQPTKDIPIKHFGNASITMTIFSSDTGVKANDAAYNESVSAGETLNHEIKLQGEDKKSTQDMRCVIETTASANVTNIVLSGFGAKASPNGLNSKPNWYTVSGTASGVYVYDIEPIEGAETKTGNIQVVTKTGTSLADKSTIVSCYTKEWFLDSYTGEVVYDVEDSLGNKQSIASYSETVLYT